MSSNSIRVSPQLFAAAKEHGEIMCRSAAQQIEHWALLGAALEAQGLAVTDAAKLLRAERQAPEQSMWDDKRAKQARDLENIKAGRSTNAQMSWFSGGRAKATKPVDSSY